jgi:hypothetical protein
MKNLSPLTKCFLAGFAAGPIVWACMVAFLLLLG